MRVIWTQEAADDLESIVNHIQKDSPDAARRVAKEIFDTILPLPSLPFRGRKREEHAGREIVFVPWPYVAVYEVIGEILYVKRFAIHRAIGIDKFVLPTPVCHAIGAPAVL